MLRRELSSALVATTGPLKRTGLHDNVLCRHGRETSHPSLHHFRSPSILTYTVDRHSLMIRLPFSPVVCPWRHVFLLR
jgi:hypothetical protein